MTALADKERRETSLAIKLVQEIAVTGPISMSEYMRRCLSDPEYGYYTTRSGIGRDGDFTTAPEISQVFGELIGLWCAVVWQQMGAPGRVNLVELGPGRGALICDALRAARVLPGFLNAVDLHLCEINEAFRKSQASALGALGFAVNAQWHEGWPQLGAEPTIVIANEFLDTIPGSQWVLDVAGQWQEIRVGVDDAGRLELVREEREPPSAVASVLPPRQGDEAIYTQTDFEPIVRNLSAQAGRAPFAALFIDYGHTLTTWGDTLQAVRAHQIEGPLCSPGEADLSLAVDFAAFKRSAVASGLAIDGPTTQAEFLGRLGIVERASKLMGDNPERANEIEVAIRRVIAVPGMGNRFQAIATRSPGLGPLPGLASAEV